jgi:hypothetical protein
MLDMSAAFDTVDHEILIERLDKTHGVRGVVLQWLKSYLSDRVQTVVCGGNKSSVGSIIRGVPQGSVLGPSLFLLYTVDIQRIIQSHGLTDHAYADDNQIYFHSPRAQIELNTRRLLDCISDISQWMSSNRLRLNPDKTEFIWFASPHHMRDIPTDGISVSDANITPSTTVRSLGVQLDGSLTLRSHVSSVVSSCFYQLKQLGRVQKSISRDNMKTLLHAFVSSRLDYCNSLLAGQPTCLLDYKWFRMLLHACMLGYPDVVQ